MTGNRAQFAALPENVEKLDVILYSDVERVVAKVQEAEIEDIITSPHAACTLARVRVRAAEQSHRVYLTTSTGWPPGSSARASR